MSKDPWAEHAANLLKAKLKERGLRYQDLAERLTAAGTPESERNLTNKISRGTFTAAFFLQCMRVIGVEDIRIDHLPQPDVWTDEMKRAI